MADLMGAAMYERTISLIGCGNFRDLGGYETRDGRKVRWRRLFRSDALSWLTAEDIDSLASQGIKLAAGFDLRTAEELDAMHRGVVYDNGTRHHHLPFFATFGEDPERMREVAYATGQVAGDRYLELLEDAQSCFEGLFNTLADEASYPAAYYCAAGKDRTGMVSAVLLRLLGVPDAQIIADYALTEAPTEERLIKRLEAMGRDLKALELRERMAARPETMEHFLAGFDRLHESAEEFLLSCNLEEGTLERVRENLLEN
jgi:protein-tyrosine phosphatase